MMLCQWYRLVKGISRSAGLAAGLDLLVGSPRSTLYKVPRLMKARPAMDTVEIRRLRRATAKRPWALLRFEMARIMAL